MPTAEHWVTSFLSSRDPVHRYASFDYCFNYFQSFENKRQLADAAHLETSCLQLGFYLASWGMFRGSSKLLRENSGRCFAPVIEIIASVACDQLWKLDVDSYTPERIFALVSAYRAIRAKLLRAEHQHLTLVTKILLGVFACTPAFDTRFTVTFRALYPDCGFRSFNPTALAKISEFYQKHATTIDHFNQQIRTLAFSNGNETAVAYTKAKIVDMIGFQAKGAGVE